MEKPEYCLSLKKPIDGICSNQNFNLLATVQRKKEYRNSYVSTVTSVTLLKVENDKLIKVDELSHKIGHQTQSSQSSIVWSTNNEYIIACTTSSGNVLLWDINKKEVCATFSCGISYAKAKFHNFDDNLMGVGSSDSSLKLYDLRKKSNSIQFPGITCVRDFDFGRHPDTKDIIVIVGDSGLVKFYDFRHPNKPLRECLAHQGHIMSVVFNNKEKNLVATGGRDKFIKLWDWSKTDNDNYFMEINAPSAVGKIVWTNVNNWQICSIPGITPSNDTGDFSTYIWDFRRPYIPYKHFLRHSDFITDVIFPYNPSIGSFCTTDVSGNIMYHKIDNIKIPMETVDVFDIAVSNVENEIIVSKPVDENILNDKYYENPENFSKQIKSTINIAKFGEENSDNEKFKYLAKNYKLFSINNESVLDLCKYNSKVAFSIGDIDLSRSWDILGVTAHDDIIASVRASLGHQIRPSNDDINDIHNNEIQEKNTGNVDTFKDEYIDLCEPSKEFCFDQELLDFCGILEEDLDCHYPDELIFGKLIRTRKKKFKPKLLIPNKEEWYTGTLLVSPDITPQIKQIPQRRYHRYYMYHRKTPSITFKNGSNGQIKRTLVSSVFDGKKSKDLSENRKNDYHTLEKIKENYQQKIANRKHEIAEIMKRKVKRKLTNEEKVTLKRKKAQRKIREINLRWIESNRILQSSRAPLNPLQRLIVNRSTDYYEKKISHELNIYKNNKKSFQKTTGFKSNLISDLRNTIKYIFDYYMTLDDIQTCACMAMCIGEKITMLISEESVDRWFYYYVDTLEKYSLFKEATAFMKASFRVTTYQLNCEFNYVKILYCQCEKNLTESVCNSCLKEYYCIICENAVSSQWLICTNCGHGGHPDHIVDWFNENDICPAVNCDHNCYPKLEKDIIELRIKKSLNILNNHERHLNKSSDRSFWKYKIPV